MERRIQYHAFSAPKSGHTAAEYEDAFAPEEASRFGATFRSAVADGATESSFSGLWARLLVNAYVNGELPADSLVAALPPLRERWQREIDRLSLPWYTDQKARRGAYAALLGLSVDGVGSESGTWDAVAVGDSCLFVVRDDTLINSFPLRKSGDLNARPRLIPTGEDTSWEPDIATARGEWLAGDTFFVMTDALAAWFLRQNEAGTSPWQALQTLRPASRIQPFSGFVKMLRDADHLTSDDTTLLRLRMG